jgi:hypothetical protein
MSRTPIKSEFRFEKFLRCSAPRPWRPQEVGGLDSATSEKIKKSHVSGDTRYQCNGLVFGPDFFSLFFCSSILREVQLRAGRPIGPSLPLVGVHYDLKS